MPNNNSEIIDRLVANEKQSTDTISQGDVQVSISSARVISIRYKIYALLLLFLILFGTVDYLFPVWDKFVGLRSILQQKQFEVTSFVNKKYQYEKDASLIQHIEEKEPEIISCVNNQIWCKQLDQSIRENFWFARSYLLLNNLYDSKMEVNEKILLANINEYLLKTNVPSWTSSTTRNGTISSVSFGDPKTVVNQLYSLPVRLGVTFASKDDLLSFIQNVDTNILENKAYRILYKIDEINYDIMKYATEQKVDIRMHAFYYKE